MMRLSTLEACVLGKGNLISTSTEYVIIPTGMAFSFRKRDSKIKIGTLEKIQFAFTGKQILGWFVRTTSRIEFSGETFISNPRARQSTVLLCDRYANTFS